MFAIRGNRRVTPILATSKPERRALESIAERLQVGDAADGTEAVSDLLEIVEDRVEVRSTQSMGRHLAELDTRQGIYLTASGTLTQFNAILAGMLATALASSVEAQVALKAALAAAIMLHIAATLFLFWASRPVVSERTPSMLAVLLDDTKLVDHTFRNYQRGWHATLVALFGSCVAAVLFVLHALGMNAAEILAVWR